MASKDRLPDTPFARLVARAAELDVEVRELHGDELEASQRAEVYAIVAAEQPSSAGGSGAVAGARVVLATGDDIDLGADVLAFAIALLHVDRDRFDKAPGYVLTIGDRLSPSGAERERSAARMLFESGRRAPLGANFDVRDPDPSSAAIVNP